MEYLGLNKTVNHLNPIVSVCVQVYNNEEFIEKCINSILNQQTSFDFEIIIGEDDSTDQTRDICKVLAENHQDKIRLFLREEKDKIYHKGRKTSRFNYMSNIKAARGKYIALCDGDDYWIDNHKLQSQYTILEQKSEIIATHHWQKHAVYKEDRWIEIDAPKGEGYGFLEKPVGEVSDIFKNKLRLKARTLMFRNIVDKKFFPDWFTKVAFADISLSFVLGKYGAFYFVDDEKAVYRQTNYGLSKSGLMELGRRNHFMEHMKNHIEIWDNANKYHDYRFSKQADQAIKLFLTKIMINLPIRFSSFFKMLRYNMMERRLPFRKKIMYVFWTSSYYFNAVTKRVKQKLKIA